MKKLRLEIDALRVESFGTGAASGGGTVNAHFDQIAPATDLDDTSRVDSCYFDTCYDTCDWDQ